MHACVCTSGAADVTELDLIPAQNRLLVFTKAAASRRSPLLNPNW